METVRIRDRKIKKVGSGINTPYPQHWVFVNIFVTDVTGEHSSKELFGTSTVFWCIRSGKRKSGRSSVSSRSREGGSLPPTKFENVVLCSSSSSSSGGGAGAQPAPLSLAWDSGGPKVRPRVFLHLLELAPPPPPPTVLSVADPDILVRIRGSVPLTNGSGLRSDSGSGSYYFLQCLSRGQLKIIFLLRNTVFFEATFT
jgi:hypothetical protein